VKSIASQFHISVSHFTRLFRAATGQTLTDYLARKRIDSICRELRLSDLPVTQIALQHGYASIRTFNRVFYSVMKKSPSAVRDER
jgi:AraC-like DNA-binding protein